MPSTRELTALFQAIGQGNTDATHAAARAIAENEKKRGHQTMADALLGSLAAKDVADNSSNRLTQSVSSIGLLIREQEGPPLEFVKLRPQARLIFREIVTEWNYRQRLCQAGVQRRSKLLFWGPPGCGKTLTTRALGHCLQLPVMTVRLSSIIGSYLGQTGLYLRQVFQYANNNSCILLLDEFDALARIRGRSDDVGEIDRVVISLLQELDHSNPAGYIIAATNLKDALDPAIWRRFDIQVEFPTPTKRDIERYSLARLRTLELTVPSKDMNFILKLRTYAEVEQRIMDFQRRDTLRKLGAKL